MIKRKKDYAEPAIFLKTVGKLKKSKQNFYKYTIQEWLFKVFCGLTIDVVFSFTFYNSFLVFLLFIPAAFMFPLYEYKRFKEKRKNQLNIQFKEAMISLAASLNAGYAIENAFREVYNEMLLMYGNQTLIVKELNKILHGLELSQPIENLLDDFAQRSELDDVKNFSEVFQIANKSGGNICSIIKETVEIIDEKLRVKEEIITITTAARYEGTVMKIMPLIIIIYMNFSARDFLMVLYQELYGRVFMTLCLCIYVGIIFLQNKIMESDL